MPNTAQEYDKVIDICQDIFVKKMQDYGTAWRILRPTSITDQIYIKANRIRSIEEKGITKVGEGIVPEFIGIINYSIMGLIQLQLGPGNDTPQDEVLRLYQNYFHKAKELMLAKNHDYDEAWREMRVSSYTDLILMKINRTKQIEDPRYHDHIGRYRCKLLRHGKLRRFRVDSPCRGARVRSNRKINKHETRQKPVQDYCRDSIHLFRIRERN